MRLIGLQPVKKAKREGVSEVDWDLGLAAGLYPHLSRAYCQLPRIHARKVNLEANIIRAAIWQDVRYKMFLCKNVEYTVTI